MRGDDRWEDARWALARLHVLLIDRPLRPVVAWLARVLDGGAR